MHVTTNTDSYFPPRILKLKEKNLISLPGVDHGRQINQQWMFTAAQVDVLRMRQLQYDKNPRVVTSRRVTVN